MKSLKNSGFDDPRTIGYTVKRGITEVSMWLTERVLSGKGLFQFFECTNDEMGVGGRKQVINELLVLKPFGKSLEHFEI